MNDVTGARKVTSATFLLEHWACSFAPFSSTQSNQRGAYAVESLQGQGRIAYGPPLPLSDMVPTLPP